MHGLRVIIGPFRQHASGVASYTVNLAMAVASTGAQVTLLTMGKLPDGIDLVPNIRVVELVKEDPQWLALAGGPVTETAVVRNLLKKHMRTVHVEHECDLVHFTGAPYAIPLGGSMASVVTAWNDLPVVQSIRRNFTGFRFPLNVASLAASLEYHWQDLVGYSRADTVVCGTQNLVRKVQSIHGSRVRRVYHPILAQEMALHTHPKSEVPTILFVARRLGLPRKNLVRLLHAIHLLIGRGLHGYRLRLVGEEGGDVKRLIAKLDLESHITVELSGYLSGRNRSDAFSTASIFAIPSIVEDYSYSLLEAMSYGLPVVASDIPSFRDITDDGSNGGLFDPWRVDSIADRLEVLLQDESARSALGERSMGLIAKRHAYSISGPKIVDLYRDAIDSIEGPSTPDRSECVR